MIMPGGPDPERLGAEAQDEPPTTPMLPPADEPDRAAAKDHDHDLGEGIGGHLATHGRSSCVRPSRRRPADFFPTRRAINPLFQSWHVPG